MIASRSVDKCEKTANEINTLLRNSSTGGRVVVGPSTNIRKEEEIQNLIEHIVEKYGALNMLVNNSGGQFIQESSEISRGGFAAVVETNLQGTFLMM